MTIRMRARLAGAKRRPVTERVHVLMFNASGQGGVARTVTRLAGRLADNHEVVIHSLVRTGDEPVFPVDPRVRINWLVDNRAAQGHARRPRHSSCARAALRALHREPSALEPGDPAISAHTDRVLRATLRKLKPGVLLTTRPMLHVAAIRWAPKDVAVVAQDHLNFVRRMRNPCVTALLDEAAPSVDAFVTLTEADLRDYRQRYPHANVVRIPNGAPSRRAERAPLHRKVAVSAGRLVAEKGFDRLVEAWAPLVAELPDWQLHIYGEGEARAGLERRIAELGVARNVVLKGYTHQLEEVLAGAGLYAMGSRAEGFPMVLLEAMSHGLPMIGFDCPRGPGELIEDRRNGRLVPDGDIAGYTQALRELLVDDETRHRLGATSFENAAAYDMDVIVREWEQLIADLR